MRIRTQQCLIGAQGWGWAGRPDAFSEHIFLKCPIFNAFKVIYLHDDGKSYEKTNKRTAGKLGGPRTMVQKDAHITGLLPSAHSVGGPNPEAHSQEVRILMPGSVPALETATSTWDMVPALEELTETVINR